MTEVPTPCVTCGRYDLAHDSEARDALLESIRQRSWERLAAVEWWNVSQSAERRLQVTRTLAAMLTREPLAHAPEDDPLKGLFRAILHDLYVWSIDPESPEVLLLGIIPQPHPLRDLPLDDGPPSSVGGTASLEELKISLGGEYA